MIKSDSPEHEKFIENHNDGNYDILTGKIPKGESIQCQDDPDMKIKINEQGEVILIKKCFIKNPFSS